MQYRVNCKENVMIDQQFKEILLRELKDHSSDLWCNFMSLSIERGDPNDIMVNCVSFNVPHILQLVLPYTNCTQDNYYKQLHNAVSDGHVQCVDLLWNKSPPSSQQGYDLLQHAMLQKHTNVAHWILKKDVDLTDRGHILLALSACQGCETLAEMLLERCDYKASLHLLRNGFMHEYFKWRWFEDQMLAREQRLTLEAVVPTPKLSSVRKI